MAVRKFIDETGLSLLNTLLSNKFQTKAENILFGYDNNGLVPSLNSFDEIDLYSVDEIVLTGDGWKPLEAGETYSAGTGISINNNVISANYGTTSETACVGNDSRLSDSRTPTSHASTATTYGVGTTTSYGHCMTINNLTTSAHANGKALSAYQGYLLNTNKAALASPTFTGTPKAPTASVANNSTQIATTAYVDRKITSGTTDYTAGTTAMNNGCIYCVYE